MVAFKLVLMTLTCECLVHVSSVWKIATVWDFSSYANVLLKKDQTNNQFQWSEGSSRSICFWWVTSLKALIYKPCRANSSITNLCSDQFNMSTVTQPIRWVSIRKYHSVWIFNTFIISPSCTWTFLFPLLI